MKNIHLIPTHKPSKLFETLQWNYVFDKHNKYSEEDKKLHGYKNKNMYITNDEEINIGDWVIEFQKADKIGEIHFINGDYVIARDIQKKIILTTDPSLSPDVHKINDEFLEWFVSNPTCDEVEVDKGYRGVNLFNYKIVIPREVSKSDNIEKALTNLEQINYVFKDDKEIVSKVKDLMLIIKAYN